MEKPIKPIEPQIKDFPRDREMNEAHPFVKAHRAYIKALYKYDADLEMYTQTKLIEDIKRSSLKLCLKKYKIKSQ